MKITIVGAGGVRTPLLVAGLTRSDLSVQSIALYDPDRARLGAMASVARRYAGSVTIEIGDTPASSIEGADFVITSIRVGGIASRARDEEAAVQIGVVGQETVGAGGLAMAMRTISPLIEYAREVERVAPRAWMINFTNPVGIMTQAVQTQTGAKVVGICDTPTELFERTAHVLGLDPGECRFDYFGLNHLGWLREVTHRGEPQLHRLWDDEKALERVYPRAELFSPRFLSSLRLLPTEYLYYYYRPGEAVGNIRRAGLSRGRSVQRLNERLFAELAEPGGDPIEIYESYLVERDAGYLQIETASTSSNNKNNPGQAQTGGYDKIALAVIRAIDRDSGKIIACDVANEGTLPELEDEDVIEVPSEVDARGARPLPVAPIPAGVRGLILEVKNYERLAIDAALTRSKETAIEALVTNPLVGDRPLASRLVERLDLL